MKKKLAWLLCCMLLVCALLVPTLAQADFGSYSGDSDYSSSSDSDWSSSSWDDDDDDYYGVGYVSDGDDGSGGGGSLLTVIVVVVILAIAFSGMRKGKDEKAPIQGVGAARTDASELRPMNEYKKEDPGFDTSALTEKMSNLYVQMQNAWQDKNIESLRPYLTDALYTQMERQLDSMKKAGRTNYIERISVLGVELRGWNQKGNNDNIVAAVRTRIVDYTVDDKTGDVVSGSKDRELFMEYEWTMTRPTGTKTGEAAPMQSVHCPSCGAPLSINHSAKCPYCDSVVTVNEHDWVIYAIKGISQRSA